MRRRLKSLTWPHVLIAVHIVLRVRIEDVLSQDQLCASRREQLLLDDFFYKLEPGVSLLAFDLTMARWQGIQRPLIREV